MSAEDFQVPCHTQAVERHTDMEHFHNSSPPVLFSHMHDISDFEPDIAKRPCTIFDLKDDGFENVTDDEIDLLKCFFCNTDFEEFNFPTPDSVPLIISYIKSVLVKVYGSNFKEHINSIRCKSHDEFDCNSFLELFLKPPQNKAVPENKIVHKEIHPVPNSRTRRKIIARKLKNRGLAILVKTVAHEEKLTKQCYNEAVNKDKILTFFPKLMTKIASKSDKLIKKILKNQQSLFILSCTARLAWNFKNIDAFALFKLSAIEIERGNLNKAFFYYKQARISLSKMIFKDKIFSFLFNGKPGLNIIKELSHSDAKYFLYRQTNIALMNDNLTFCFTFDKTDCTKLNETEINGEEANMSIDYSPIDLKKVATKFISNSDKGKNSDDDIKIVDDVKILMNNLLKKILTI